MSTITDFDIKPLLDEVVGPVLVPRDDGFEAEYAGFNLLARHRPAVIVGATGPADVMAAVRFAVDRGLPVAVLATGHQHFDPADGSVLITTARMASVQVDAANRAVRVTAGTVWRQVIEAAAKEGLAPLNGSSPGVGVIGYVLGGGQSPTMGRTYGWAADHVRAIEVVTADGALRRVTATEDADLFWAIRGAKSNFGVVTAIELDLFPVTEYYGGGIFFEARHTAAVLTAYRELITDAPDELNSSIALLRLPPMPFVPEFAQGRLVVHLRISYLGSTEEGERLLAPIRLAAPAIVDMVAMTPYELCATIHQDPTDPVPYLDRTFLLGELTAGAVDRIVELAGPDSDFRAQIVDIRHLGGALGRPGKSPNAVGNRDAQIVILAAALGGPDETELAIGDVEELLTALQPWSTGRKYLNFMSSHDAPEEAYSTETLQRLQTVKATYDPGNVFCSNCHNILPA